MLIGLNGTLGTTYYILCIVSFYVIGSTTILRKHNFPKITIHQKSYHLFFIWNFKKNQICSPFKMVYQSICSLIQKMNKKWKFVMRCVTFSRWRKCYMGWLLLEASDLNFLWGHQRIAILHKGIDWLSCTKYILQEKSSTVP